MNKDILGHPNFTSINQAQAQLSLDLYDKIAEMTREKKEKDEFIAAILHELSTSFQTVCSTFDLLSNTTQSERCLNIIDRGLKGVELAIVSKLVNLLGGSIILKSVEKDGSLFDVTIPVKLS
jgi:signal transduction histidine kinase